MARKHVMTAARKRALRKAQLASARNRKHVTLYHYTTQKRAGKIIAQQRLRPSRNIFSIGNRKDQVYFTRRRSLFYQTAFTPASRRNSAVTVRVPQRYVKRDPNDLAFLKNDWKKATGYTPAHAYMVDQKYLQGRKIRAA